MSVERWFGAYRVVDRAGRWYILDRNDFFIAVYNGKWAAIKHAKQLHAKKRAATPGNRSKMAAQVDKS